MRFTKMQGIGNDYIYINGLEQFVSDPARLARVMSAPHFGVGADGLVLIEADEMSDFGMRIFNRDGSEAEMCGNALRCIGKYVYERGLTEKTELVIHTLGGLRRLWLEVDDGRVLNQRADMGTPELNPRALGIDLPGELVLRHRLQILGQTMYITGVGMGNPHCVVFVRDPDIVDVETLGPLLETHPLFPQRINVEFVGITSRDRLQMRVWERGSGETLGCGTGACAAVVAAVLCGLSDRKAWVRLPGGELNIHWNAEDNHVYQSGPAEFVFDGEWLGGL